jgi:hypothetical protein
MKIWLGLGSVLDYKLSQPVEYLDMYVAKFGGMWDSILGLNPKLHTLRVDSKDIWHAGQSIHMRVFNRTKDTFQFAPVVKCVSTQDIKIIHTPGSASYRVLIDGLPTSLETVALISENDGFDTLDEFLDYFDKGFEGKIIHWTKLRY